MKTKTNSSTPTLTRWTRTASVWVIGLVLCAGMTAQAQTNSIWQEMIDSAKQFVANNPTNTYDVSVYGVANKTDKYGYGGGLRVGYWMTPSVGAALDLNYCDSSWMFTSLGLAGRGTIKAGTIATVSLYASAGAGWNIQGAEQTVVGVVGTGGTLHINGWDYFDLFSEYQHVTISPDSQNRILVGLTRRF
jgi:hypothetical protein